METDNIAGLTRLVNARGKAAFDPGPACVHLNAFPLEEAAGSG
jgi:hypothetical protein